jgi:uncharacterized membrane protein
VGITALRMIWVREKLSIVSEVHRCDSFFLFDKSVTAVTDFSFASSIKSPTSGVRRETMMTLLLFVLAIVVVAVVFVAFGGIGMALSFRPFVFQMQLTFRVAAAVLLLALVAVLVWGTHWQRAPTDPFRVPGFFAWLFSPLPHPAYGEMPVVSVGSSLGLIPRTLCAKPNSCGGLKVGPDGSAIFQDSIGHIWNAARLHWSARSGQLFAITPSGELFTLVVGTELAWQKVLLPGEPLIFKKSLAGTSTNRAGGDLSSGFSPVVQSIASSTTGGLWVIGPDCYAWHSANGRSWTIVFVPIADFLALAAAGPEKAVALTEKIISSS